MNDTFNVEEVKTKMSTLETKFEEFATTLKDVNTVVNELVNNGADSAIFGEVGSTLLNTWNYNASTFGDFHNNFQNWTEVVSVIAANNAEFVVTAESIYANHGGNLDGVAEARKTFTDNPKESTYYQSSFQKEATDFLTAYGAISNGTTAWLNNYDKLSPEAKAIVTQKREELEGLLAETNMTAFVTNYNKLSDSEKHTIQASLSPSQQAAVFNNEIGLPDGSAEWKDKFDALSPEARAAYVNQYGGSVANRSVADSSYRTTSVVPQNGEYDGRTVVIPKLTAQDFEQTTDQNALRNQNAQIIVASATAVKENLSGESIALQGVLDTLPSNENFNALSQEQQIAVRSYLQTEITARNTIAEKIGSECYAGAGIDGTVGDATSYIYTVEHSAPDAIKGASTQYSDYAEAMREAESWNESLTSLNSVHDISAYLNSYGINSNGR